MGKVASHDIFATAPHFAIDVAVEPFTGVTGGVNVFEGDIAIVVTYHLHAVPESERNASPARFLEVAVAAKKPIEMFVVTHLVFGDIGGQLAQYRFGAEAT